MNKEFSKLSKKELIDVLRMQIEYYKGLPDHAMNVPVTHSDLISALSLVLAILDCDAGT